MKQARNGAFEAQDEKEKPDDARRADGDESGKFALAVALTLALGTSSASTPNYTQKRTEASAHNAMLDSLLKEASEKHATVSKESSTHMDSKFALNYGKNFENYAKNFENYAKNFENYAKNFENYGRNFLNPDIAKRSENNFDTVELAAVRKLPNGADVPSTVSSLLEKIHARDAV